VCFPEPLEGVERYRSTNGLCDVSLALETEGAVVGNSLSSVNQSLYVITGANQGGKTTFLRSIGQAQLMMQCGMFVAAKAYSSHVSTGVYSHFKREEDSDMRSGKLDEELARMSRIVDNILPGGLMLLNESFAATNEREGAEIGRQITTALVENGIEVFFVTHLFTYADTFYRRQRPDVCFLRAERLDDGERTFRITPGRPLKTGFGEDLYSKIFGTSQE
jgi:DNA mismatch repair ATPase MutS